MQDKKSKEDEFKCKKCNRVFATKQSKVRHMERWHPSPAMNIELPCPDCDKTFGCLSNLNYHKKAVHSNSIFTCDKCGKDYKTKKSLVRHCNYYCTEDPTELKSAPPTPAGLPSLLQNSPPSNPSTSQNDQQPKPSTSQHNQPPKPSNSQK